VSLTPRPQAVAAGESEHAPCGLAAAITPGTRGRARKLPGCDYGPRSTEPNVAIMITIRLSRYTTHIAQA
jgi:hypothetical protein